MTRLGIGADGLARPDVIGNKLGLAGFMSPGLPEFSGNVGLTNPDDPGVIGNTGVTGFTGETPIPAGDMDIGALDPIGAIDKLEAARGATWPVWGTIPGGVKLVIISFRLLLVALEAVVINYVVWVHLQ